MAVFLFHGWLSACQLLPSIKLVCPLTTLIGLSLCCIPPDTDVQTKMIDQTFPVGQSRQFQLGPAWSGGQNGPSLSEVVKSST